MSKEALPTLFDGRPLSYATIVADPPWGYDWQPKNANARSRSKPWRSTSPQTYPLMSLAEIKALPVATVAKPDAHLYLWATLPMMREAYEVVEAWGFLPETIVTWCKPGPGLGAGFRGNTEHLIVARRGFSSINPTCENCRGRVRGAKKCSCAEPDWRFMGKPVSVAPRLAFSSTAGGTWYVSPRGKHSAKPEIFMDLVEQMSPGPYLELFARSQRPGWDVWGNEVESDITLGTEDAA